MVTPEEVTLAYRLFLGREPENKEVVSRLCSNVQSIGNLRAAFLNSAEFARAQGRILNRSLPQRHPFHLPRIPVETNVTRNALTQIFERIKKQWEHLGDTEPYWSVVTQPQYYKAAFEQYREQFYESGSHSRDLFLAALRRAGVNPSDLATCLEVGCGVGRVTGHLAAAFNTVLATDISLSHLQLARAELSGKGIKNVHLEHWMCVEQLENLPEVDAIFSLITLQHNPPPVIAWMLSVLLAKLRPGGVAYFQIPTYRNGYIFEVDRYLGSPAARTLEMHFLPQAEVFSLIVDARCQCLEVREDGMVGDESEMLSNTFLVRKF